MTNTIIMAVLTPESREHLLSMLPPVHARVAAHHVTIAFKPPADMLEAYLPHHGRPVKVPLTCTEVWDDKAQAVEVKFASTNEHPHITVSLADEVRAAYSNELLARLNGHTEEMRPWLDGIQLDAVITIETLL